MERTLATAIRRRKRGAFLLCCEAPSPVARFLFTGVLVSIFVQLAWFFRLEWRRYATAMTALACVAGLVMIPPKLTGYLVDAIAQDSLTREQLWLYCGGIVTVAVVVYG